MKLIGDVVGFFALVLLTLVFLAAARVPTGVAGQVSESDKLFFDAFELYRGGKLKEAAAKFEQGLKTSPKNAIAHYYLAETYADLNERDKARQHHEKSLSLDPKSQVAPNAKKRLNELAQSRETQNPAKNEPRIIIDVIDVSGRSVRQQKLTLQCPYFDVKEGWLPQLSTYTLHIMDLAALPSSSKPRLAEHGFYSFIQNRWFEFDRITENRLEIAAGSIDAYYEDQTRRRLKKDEPCADYTKYIDRNTLDMVCVANRDPHKAEYYNSGRQKFVCDKNAFPKGTTEVRRPCTVLSYKAPAERIGF